MFCALRDLFGTAQHWRWGSLGSDNSAGTVTRLSQPGSEVYNTVALHYFVQFHLDAQLRAAAAHAKRVGVILKGDLPIGVDKASVDTWMYPNLFRMHTSTGAPPDDFDANGQNWGFPTYNWEEMSKDGTGGGARGCRTSSGTSRDANRPRPGILPHWSPGAHARGADGAVPPSGPFGATNSSRGACGSWTACASRA